MKVTNTLVNITSDNPERLMKFYTEVVGLPKNPDMGDGAVDAGGTTLGFDGHSKVTRCDEGAGARAHRLLRRGHRRGAEAPRGGRREVHPQSQGKEYWGGIISTFTDPDGNLVQLIEYRPEAGDDERQRQPVGARVPRTRRHTRTQRQHIAR